MRHANDGALRRLLDEPFAVTDSTFDHIAGCGRCQARRRRIADTAGAVAGRLSVPQPVPDVDRAWADLQRQLGGPERQLGGPERRPARRQGFRPARLAGLSARGGVVAGAVAVAVAGTAAGATITGVFAPTRVAPVTVNPGDIQAISGLMNLADVNSPGGFPTPSGTGSLPFGTIRWTSSGPAEMATSASQAQNLSGIPVVLPSRLPTGVGAPTGFAVQPKLTATLTFDSAAGRLAGATVDITVGPAVFVEYGSRSSSQSIPTLGILTMPRPTASSTGATIAQIESFLLSRPGIPSQLSYELKLLGNISDVLPVPAPAGMNTSRVHVGRWPAILIADPSHVASGVAWEDGSGLVHLVAGLVSSSGIMNVAGQLP